MKLYSYWRSSTSYKVRIALNLKGLDYDVVPVHLVNNGGEQHAVDYTQLNPMQAVPTLVDQELTCAQSNTILEYLEEQYPAPALLPEDIKQRAYIRQIMNIVACDIHPVNNLRILKYLVGSLEISQMQKNEWYAHWIHQGFRALNEMMANSAFHTDAGYVCGSDFSFAEATLIPQMYNARRFDVDLDAYPVLTKIEAHCLENSAFIKALPENQTDAVPA